VTLGNELFHDARLSKDNRISCSSCHDLQHGGGDGKIRSLGIQGAMGDINAPTVFNSGFNFRQFWNGRARTLEDQIDGPVQNAKEMGSTWGEVISKVKSDNHYVALFKKVYRDDPTHEHIKDAIATFERALTTPNSRFDRYLRGDDSAITAFEKQGYSQFKSYGCVACHQGMNVGGNMYQTMGVMGDYFKERGTPITDADWGRYAITKLEEDKHVFRVPSLRNVALTAPYFHDGSAKTLNGAVQVMAKYQLGRKLSKQDIEHIVAFLKTLTGETPAILKLPKEIKDRK
jgi:cytochrome c peroxidase